MPIKQETTLIVHENWVDVENRELWIHGVDTSGVDYNGLEPGIEYMCATKTIKNLHILRKKSETKPVILHLHSCFDGMTKVETKDGRKYIKDIKIGDEVLTHKNRYRKVVDTMKRKYLGEKVRLGYGRNGSAQMIAATIGHPVLVERDGVKTWVPIEEIEINDVVFTLSKTCPITGELIPYYRDRVKKKPTEFKRGVNTCSMKHLQKDIIPFCDSMEGQGWRMVPVGGNVTPDAIGFKDGKIVAFEVENTENGNYGYVKFKKTKYENHVINNYIDDVRWEIIGKDPEKDKIRDSNSWFEADESGFCKVKIVSKSRYQPTNSRRDVYNLTVKDDNSYVASGIVVHNCGGFWEEGMAIYDTIRMMPFKTIIVSYTHARSMSSIILQAGYKRLMLPNSCFMFHYGTLGVEGEAKTVYSNVDFARQSDEIMIGIYAERVSSAKKFKGKSDEQIKASLREQMDKKGDVFLRAEEAVEWGFADGILTNWKDLAKYMPRS